MLRPSADLGPRLCQTLRRAAASQTRQLHSRRGADPQACRADTFVGACAAHRAPKFQPGAVLAATRQLRPNRLLPSFCSRNRRKTKPLLPLHLFQMHRSKIPSHRHRATVRVRQGSGPARPPMIPLPGRPSTCGHNAGTAASPAACPQPHLGRATRPPGEFRRAQRSAPTLRHRAKRRGNRHSDRSRRHRVRKRPMVHGIPDT